MLLFILCFTLSPKPYLDIGLGLGWVETLNERNNSPYHPDQVSKLCLYGNLGAGTNIFSRVNLTLFWEGYSSAFSSHHEGGALGAKINIALPVVGCLSGTVSTKCGIIAEKTILEGSPPDAYNESYSQWGYWPEATLYLYVPKSKGALKFIYEYYDLGLITLKEEFSKGINYENLIINKYSVGYCFLSNVSSSPPAEASGVFSLINKSDGRKDWFIMLNFSGVYEDYIKKGKL
jgi:hypothetical protein